MKTHTPTPWHIEKYMGRYDIWRKDDGSAHGAVATVQTQIDAELICRAVNTHAELLEACKALIEPLTAENKHLSTEIHLKNLERAHKAIAHAEGHSEAYRR